MMDDSRNTKFQSILQDVELLSKILKISVTVVDDNLHRIAGSGKYMGKEIKSKSSIAVRGGIFAHVIQEKQAYIIDNPRENILCAGCEFKEHCPDKYEMSAPILVDGIVVGALGFIASTNLERNRMEKNRELYQQILTEFTDIFALKIGSAMAKDDHMTHMELFNAFLNHTASGVLVLNREKKIAAMNDLAKNLFFDVDDLSANAVLKKLETGNEEDTFWLTFGKQDYILLGKLYHINLEDYSDILVFMKGEEQKKKQNNLAFNQNVTFNIAFGTEAGKQIDRKIYQFAKLDASVFITGEEGTEKQEAARAIHDLSKKNSGQFVSISCRTEDEKLFERELFGYIDKTGKNISGKLDIAKGGTLLLENVDELSVHMQNRVAELLRRREYTKLGNHRKRRMEARVMATASDAIQNKLINGTFLWELYYRLNVLSLHLPPLRERKRDIQLRGEKFLQITARRMSVEIQMVSDAFWTYARLYEWPGNLWELENAMEYAVSMIREDGTITEQELPENILKNATAVKVNTTLEEAEKKSIMDALKKADLNVSSKDAVAKQLGISLSTLYRKMKQYGIEIKKE